MSKSQKNQLIVRIMRKSVQLPRILYFRMLSDNIPIKNQSDIRQPVLFSGQGTINLGKCNLGVWPSASYFSGYIHMEARSATASISIDDHVWINNNACIIADRTSITIQRNTLIGPNLTIFDSDFHGIQPDKRFSGEYETKPVIIESNVFIGANVTILKGVTIGQGSIIGSGSVVSKSIPPNVIASGMPAKVIKHIES